MEIPLNIHGNMYEQTTIQAWQNVWDRICKMAYEGTDICEKIITTPGIMRVNGKVVTDKRESAHTHEYARREPVNTYFLTLDNVWKQYSSYYGSTMPKVIPEFKELIVPYVLFNDIGVRCWFEHSFPNCKVYYWDE